MTPLLIGFATLVALIFLLWLVGAATILSLGGPLSELKDPPLVLWVGFVVTFFFLAVCVFAYVIGEGVLAVLGGLGQ